MDRTSHDYHAHTPWPHPGPTAHGVHNTHLTYAQRAASHAIHSPSHVDHTASRTGSCTHACHLSHTQAQARRQQRCTVPTHPALHCIGTPQHSAPHRTVPHHTTPHHTTQSHTTPHHTAPHHTVARACRCSHLIHKWNVRAVFAQFPLWVYFLQTNARQHVQQQASDGHMASRTSTCEARKPKAVACLPTPAVST